MRSTTQHPAEAYNNAATSYRSTRTLVSINNLTYFNSYTVSSPFNSTTGVTTRLNGSVGGTYHESYRDDYTMLVVNRLTPPNNSFTSFSSVVNQTPSSSSLNTTTGTGTGTVATTTKTIYNYTATERREVSGDVDFTRLSLDTSSSIFSQSSRSTRYENNNITTSSTASNGYSSSGARTFRGSSSTVHTLQATLGNLQALSVNTGAQYSALTTNSYEVNETLSSWRAAVTFLPFPGKEAVFTPGSTHPDYNPLIYIDSSFGTITQATGMGVVWVTTFTITTHAFSPLVDSLFYLDAGIRMSEFRQPVRFWTFKTALMGIGASTRGVFTDLYASLEGNTHLLEDFRLFSTSERSVTLHTLSEYSINTTTTMATRAGAITGSVATTQTIRLTSFLGSTSNFSGFVLSNIATGINVVAVAGVELKTETLGTGTGTYTTAYPTHQLQETGIEDFEFTSSTYSAYFGSWLTSSFTYWNWYSSFSSSINLQSRMTLADTILIPKYTILGEGAETTARLLGHNSTTTSVVFTPTVSTSVPVYADNFNQFVSVWEMVFADSSSNTAITALRGITEGYTIGLSAQFLTSRRVLPHVWSFTNDSQRLNPLDANSGVAYRAAAYPRGYLGWGAGHSDGEALSPHVTVTANKIAGEEFPSVSLNISELETALIHQNLTMFPVKQPLSGFSLQGGVGSYVSSVGSLGGASVDATWTSTSSTTGADGTIPITVSKTARYAVGLQTPITGDFFEEGVLASGGLGGNMPDTPWSVTIGGYGRVSWTAYYEGSTGGSSTVFVMNDAYTTFVLSNGNAVAFSAEPMLAASFGDNFGISHFSTTPQFS